MTNNKIQIGKLFIISGPSGSGKTTLCEMLFKDMPELVNSISATTRKPRKGEVHGRDYYFLSEKAFKEKIQKGYFAEWCIVYGNYYGTPYEYLNKTLTAGKDIILEIDVQGAKIIKIKYPESVLIFIEPPSINTLRSRLEKRKKDSKAVIKNRINIAANELSEMKIYDFKVVNDKLETAYYRLKKYIIRKKGG